MFYRRSFACFVLAISLTLPAAGTVNSPDSALQTARQKFKSKEYRQAIAVAKEAAPSGERDFIAGLAAYRLEQWEDAATALGRAAATYPLLSDYARLYQAQAFDQLKRPAEMISPLATLLVTTPDSPLCRQALHLLADAHYQKEAWADAYAAYQRYIAKYPAGTESLKAAYRSALCKERLGEPAIAVNLLHRLWLTSPGAPLAEKAAADLQRLQIAGQTIPTATPEDFYKRATYLYDLKRYDSAIKALQAVPLNGLSSEFSAKVQLKTGQAMFRGKKYSSAELVFSGLLPTAKGQSAETWYWLARTLDRNDKDREALAAYRTVINTFAGSDLADDALYQAALLTAESGPWAEVNPLLERLIKEYPRSDLKTSAQWELAWGNYRHGDNNTAVAAFKRLLESDTYRDRALYWLARSSLKAGDQQGAQTTITKLLEEFPYGYYAQTWRKENGLTEPPLPAVPADLPKLLPWPTGFAREKALIALGLTTEARTELGQHRSKLPRGATAAGLARLLLEIEDYNGAFHLLKKRPRKLDKEPLLAWALSYPYAYRDAVVKHSRKNDLPASLVYAVMRTESSFSPTVTSPAGAIGLMQLMPATAALMTNGNGSAVESLKQPEHNIKLGSRHLRDLLNLYKGDQIAVIAAYNAGAHNVDRWRKSFGQVPTAEFIERIPFGETRDYVKKVLAAAAVYRQLYPGQEEEQTTTTPAFTLYSTLNDD